MPDVLCLDCGARFHLPKEARRDPGELEHLADHYSGCAPRTALDPALLDRLARYEGP